MRLNGNRELPGGARLIQVATTLAAQAQPGHWFRLRLDTRELTLPALDASPREGWIAFQLAAPVGQHIRHLPYGSPCTLHGPLGAAFPPPVGDRRRLLLVDETGLACALFSSTVAAVSPTLVLAELSTTPPPVRLCPSRFLVTGLPPGAIAGLAPLESAGIASRTAHPAGLPGCADGDINTLLDAWLDHRSAQERWQACATVAGSEDFVERVESRLRGRVGQHRGYPPPTTPGY